jgi:hypothetical protein
MFYGGPLSDTWFVALGGFYRRSDGIRSTQFPADSGGQFSTSLRHTTTGGEIAFIYVRPTTRTWLLPIPLTVANGAPSSFSGFPAARARSATTRFVNLEVNKGGGTVLATRPVYRGRPPSLTAAWTRFSETAGRSVRE